MPSSDASKMELDATFSYKPKVQANIYKEIKPKSNPQQERKIIDKLIKQNIKKSR